VALDRRGEQCAQSLERSAGLRVEGVGLGARHETREVDVDDGDVVRGELDADGARVVTGETEEYGRSATSGGHRLEFDHGALGQQVLGGLGDGGGGEAEPARDGRAGGRTLRAEQPEDARRHQVAARVGARSHDHSIAP
jgi:hypothetical protein